MECFPRPVVLDDRRNAPEPAPTLEDGPDAGPGLFAQAYAAESADDPGVADLLLSRIQEFLGRCERVARIPQQRAVVEEPDRRLAGVIGVVLVDQQIDRGLPEGNVIRRPVDPLQCLRVDGKGFLGALQIVLHERSPGLHEVGLDHQPVGPAFLLQFFRPVAAAPLAVHDRTRLHMAERRVCAKQEDRGARRQQPAAGFDDQAPVVEELRVRQ